MPTLVFRHFYHFQTHGLPDSDLKHVKEISSEAQDEADVENKFGTVEQLQILF